MEKLETLNKLLLESRKNGDTLCKNLLLTFKGEYENQYKDSKVSSDELIESIAKKMVKNAETINSEDSIKEIEVLKMFMPQSMSESEMQIVVERLVDLHPDKPFGFYMGMLMKNKRLDGKITKQLLTNKLKM